MSDIGYALRTAKQYYSEKGYDHAIRVAGYVAENPMVTEDKMDTSIALAIMHDLLEDTDYKCDGRLTVHIIYSLKLLTRDKKETYEDYISRIKANVSKFPESYWVKLADMKDHLSQKETLTDKLRDKYLSALPELL